MPHKTPIVSPEAISPLGFVAPPDIQIECGAFSGSLATLFQCVRDRKIDLLGVPMAPICQAYLEYLLGNSEQDIESAAVAIMALSYLLERKVWLLLPGEAEEPDGEDILSQIEPYVHEFMPAIEALKVRQEERDLQFFRQPGASADAYELPLDTSQVTLDDLAGALERLMARAKPDKVEPLSGPRRSLTEQMTTVMKELNMEFRSLDVIVVGEFTRSEVVWWFLALLELIRLGQARVKMGDGDVLFARGAEA